MSTHPSNDFQIVNALNFFDAIGRASRTESYHISPDVARHVAAALRAAALSQPAVETREHTPTQISHVIGVMRKRETHAAWCPVGPTHGCECGLSANLAWNAALSALSARLAATPPAPDAGREELFEDWYERLRRERGCASGPMDSLSDDALQMLLAAYYDRSRALAASPAPSSAPSTEVTP